MSRPFERVLAGKKGSKWDSLKHDFPGIPAEQITMAMAYEKARINFIKTLSQALSDSDKHYQIALFSKVYWKIDE
jgi:hypothetical protein